MRVRDDKRADEATGPDVICQLFSAQTRKMATAQEAVAARARARPAAAGAGCGGDPVAAEAAEAEATAGDAAESSDEEAGGAGEM